MIEVMLHNFPEFKLFFALNKTKKEVADFLFSENIPILDVVDYINKKIPNENGRTTLFKENGLILIKLDYFNPSIRYISILAHEILHATNRIIGDCNREEAVAYMFDYIFEEIMKILQPEIDYIPEPRDFEWFDKMVK